MFFGLFILCNLFFYWDVQGDDLSSSYIACNLLINKQSGALYEHNQKNFSAIESPVWLDVAKSREVVGYLHPYVQAPLWAFALKPLCGSMYFPVFNHLFLSISFVAIAVFIWLAAYMWAPLFLEKPLCLGALLILFSLTSPLSYTAFLNQTHGLFLLATLVAIFLADRQYFVAAGILLAFTALIKITPGIVVVYWLINKQWRAMAAFLVSIAGLAIISILELGMAINFDYLANLHRISNVLLVAFNNQSLAAWMADVSGHYSFHQIFDWQVFPLPLSYALIGFGMIELICIFLYWLHNRYPTYKKELYPFGISLLLSVSMMFMNIAWSHYYILLILPIMIICDYAVKTKNRWLFGMIGIMAILNTWPVASMPDQEELYAVTIIRSQFFSGLICCVSLIFCLISLPKQRQIAKAIV